MLSSYVSDIPDVKGVIAVKKGPKRHLHVTIVWLCNMISVESGQVADELW